MKYIFVILYFLGIVFNGKSQTTNHPDFKWGNASYFNIKVGDSIYYNNTFVKLLALENHYNKLQIGPDIFWMKVSKHSLPQTIGGVQIFVADNKNVKALTNDNEIHGLLKKDALICLLEFNKPWLNPNQFVYPVSFSDGFLWNTEEDSHMFSYMGFQNKDGNKYYRSHEGIDIDLHDARFLEKHWIVAIENSTVIWVEDKNIGDQGKEADVLLESESTPGIYYVYSHLYNKNLEVKKGQKLNRGELIGTIWGDSIWGHLQLDVVKSDTTPTYQNKYFNSVNFFPQLFELYHHQSISFSKSFSKGSINFGKLRSLNGNCKNTTAFEEFTGKGWVLDKWNKPDKVEWVLKGEEGNARLKKTLFLNEPAQSTNPENWYDYQINVQNGVYRVRAKVGDLFLPTWQKISFEGILAATYNLKAGELKWTNEKVVKVSDRKLTIRIYVDEKDEKYAGLSEIVFQRAY